jgi:hypothetical protein
MLSYQFYKLIHFLGIWVLFFSFGAGYLYLKDQAAKGLKEVRPKVVVISNSVGLVFILLGGFGMLARLGIHWPWPNWIALKFAAWVLLGFTMMIVKRRLVPPVAFAGLALLIATLAGYLGIWKPF